MIGRFSKLGTYRELVQSKQFVRTLLAGALALVSFLWDDGSGAMRSAVLALISVAINGLPIIWGAIKGIWEHRVNVDELVSIAIIASLIQGEFLTAAVVSFVMVMGSLIEQATSDSARKAIHSLINLSPRTATVLADGKAVVKPISEVVTGEILVVRPGDRIPVDAVIKKGKSAVDESPMTGEPIPRDKVEGDSVYAGTLNLNGLIEVEATKVGTDTTLGKVIRLISDAEAHKPRAVKLVDRYARWFTPLILSCAGVAWLLTGDVSRAVTVLIVGCPCALILAAPTALVATIGRAAKSGILVKGGRYLEEAARADVVLFDKTGTLTEGKPRVSEVIPAEGVDARDVLMSAACVEQHSTHPLAHAVREAARRANVTLVHTEGLYTEIGFGVSGRVQGKLTEVKSAFYACKEEGMPSVLYQATERARERGATPLLVCEDERPLGIINVADTVRASAKETVERLCSMGMKHVGILSGDHRQSACLVADSLGLTDTWAELKPDEKLSIIRDFQSSGRVVIFVGDGINDGPALASANVGIAMGAAGTDVALETADIVLMHDDISKVPFLLGLSRRMVRVIKWNIAFGLVFNTAAVLASGGGYLSPIMGALVHNIGSVLVVLSSASMAFIHEPPPRSFHDGP